EHRWGKPIHVPYPNTQNKKNPLPIEIFYYKRGHAARRFEVKFQNDLKDGKSAEKLLVLAEWALERGLVPEVLKSIGELKALDLKHPVPQAVEQTQAAMKKPPAQEDPAAASLVEELTKEGYRNVRSETGHFTLLTNVKAAASDEGVKRRLAR